MMKVYYSSLNKHSFSRVITIILSLKGKADVGFSKATVALVYICLLALLMISAFAAKAECPTYPSNAFVVNGGNGSYNINSSDVYLFKGNFTGNINSLPKGSKIYIDADATFKPGSISNPAGEINNCGTTYIPQNFNTNSGLVINNYGKMSFEYSFNMNGQTTFYNGLGATMTFTQSLKLQNRSGMVNDGTVEFLADLTTDSGTKLVNTAYMNASNSNYNINLNGAIENSGVFTAAGFINMNSSMSLTNNCTFISKKGFINGGAIINNALILIEESGLQNNGTISMGGSSLIQGVDFTNDGTVSGIGSFYFTGTTINQGTFAKSSKDYIVFYDKSSTNNAVFDVNNSKTTSKATRSEVTSYVDTNTFTATCATCSDVVSRNSTSTLPVELVSFTVKKDANSQAQLTWSTASEENNAYFEIQRSVDGKTWEVIGKVTGAGNSSVKRSYTFTDTDFERIAVTTVYYRLNQIDTDNATELSKIVALEQVINVGKIEGIYFNATTSVVEVNYSNLKANSMELVIVDLGGKVLLNRQFNLNDSYGTVTVPVDGATKGIYVVKAASGTSYLSSKFMK
ncbi:T9SS type A sorting domain-containing protein [Pontibacter silvestris]|uniref:T9SS type A sorting domain-containing protein n=1 Tax=Pontibacter silvestris TaxID=2305183 RepID=A0ABW4WZD2_9BACT|nr:T9SS type A sorting domain-containing protein [Pontibacter silvestris]MCC9135346.1 T9SS type A sorting domain-containing protein [Pontibacter silvestris]